MRRPPNTFSTDKELERLRHIDVAHLWMQDELRSKGLRVRTAKSEENDADLGTKRLSKAVIAKHCLAVGYVNMAEENIECKLQDVATFWDFGSIQMIVTGGRTVSAQNTASDHVKKSSRGTCSSIGSSSKRTSSR